MSIGNKHAYLWVVLFLAFILRLYRLHYPLLDWHSFRQADTASVTLEFMRHHYPIWRPHYHDLGNTQSGLYNTGGDRMVEFPLVNYVLSIIFAGVASADLVLFLRFASVVVATLSVGVLYALIYQWSGKKDLALLSAFIMAVLPFGVYFGRAILPEPYQLCLILLSLYSFTVYLKHPTTPKYLATLAFYMLAMLVKPTSIFMLPLLLLLAWQQYRWRLLAKFEFYLLAALAILPAFVWQQYIKAFPAGIPNTGWLLNGDGIRLRPSWWWWLFYRRLTVDWLGYWGIAFLLVGTLPEKLLPKFWSPLTWRLYFWLLSVFIYLVVFATGNVRHDYYQYLALPIVCTILARGILFLIAWLRQYLKTKLKVKKIYGVPAHAYENIHLFLASLPVLLWGLLAWQFAWRQNVGKFNINRWDQAKIGAVANQILPDNAVVVADTYGEDTNFLWQTQRVGFASLVSLEEKIIRGATHLVRCERDEIYQQLLTQYPLLYEDEYGYIFTLSSGTEASGQAKSRE